MDLQSLLGYSQGSPYAGNPYLDINTPEGLIDMSNTPIDLMGIDNYGNKKRMKRGRKKPYQFAGNVVTEIPIAQNGGKRPPIYTNDMSKVQAYNDSARYNAQSRADVKHNEDHWRSLRNRLGLTGDAAILRAKEYPMTEADKIKIYRDKVAQNKRELDDQKKFLKSYGMKRNDELEKKQGFGAYQRLDELTKKYNDSKLEHDNYIKGKGIAPASYRNYNFEVNIADMKKKEHDPYGIASIIDYHDGKEYVSMYPEPVQPYIYKQSQQPFDISTIKNAQDVRTLRGSGNRKLTPEEFAQQQKLFNKYNIPSVTTKDGGKEWSVTDSKQLIDYHTKKELDALRANPKVKEVFAPGEGGKSLGFRPIPQTLGEKLRAEGSKEVHDTPVPVRRQLINITRPVTPPERKDYPLANPANYQAQGRVQITPSTPEMMPAPVQQPTNWSFTYPGEQGMNQQQFFNSQSDYEAALKAAASGQPVGNSNFMGSSQEGNVYSSQFKTKPKQRYGGILQTGGNPFAYGNKYNQQKVDPSLFDAMRQTPVLKTNALPTYDLRDPRIIDAERRATSVGPARVLSIPQQQANLNKKIAYAEQHAPYAQVVNGELKESFPNYNISGEPTGPNEQRFEKGLEHIKTGAEVAGMLTGAGELAMGLRGIKPSANMLYRGIGKEGMEDALKSGVFRAKQNVEPIMQNGFDLSKQFKGTYYTPKFNTAAQYGEGYLAEVPKDVTVFRNRYGNGKNWSQIADENIPIDKGRILKKNWLGKYQEVKQAPKDVWWNGTGYQNVPPSSQEVLSRSSGMDAIFEKTPGYNAHLYNHNPYEPPTTDPNLMATLSEEATHKKHYLPNYGNTLDLRGMQRGELKEGWDAARKLNNQSNRFVNNAINPESLSQSKNYIYKNWDDIQKELAVRDMFDIQGGKRAAPPNFPVSSDYVESTLENYNPSRFNNTKYATLKKYEDIMHNDRVAASYFYPEAAKGNKLVPAVKYDPRLDKMNLIEDVLNGRNEQMVDMNPWSKTAHWKDLSESFKPVIESYKLNPAVESDVEKFRKIMTDAIYKTNKDRVKNELGKGYGFDLFKGMSVQKLGGNIYQQGGITSDNIMNFLFDDNDEEEAPATAPSTEEVKKTTSQEGSPEENVDDPDANYEMAVQIANGNAAGNPYEQLHDMTPKQTTGNPYSNDLQQYGADYKNLDSNVTQATEELLERFPNLRLTSGRRSWGDKDAHPLGRAVDLSYDPEAYEYYKNVIIPKYGFNPALKPNHGTGPHIHLGYY